MKNTIIFDLDDTLYDLCWPFKMAVEKYYAKCTNNVEATRALDLIEDIFLASRRHSDEIFPKWTANQVTTDDMYAHRNMNAFKDFGIDITREDALLIQRFYKEFQKKICLTDDVKRMLDELKERGVKMGIISNGGGEHQMSKIYTLGLTEWIPEANILVSGDVGAAKPDPRIFDFARWKLKIKRDEAWFVGDTFENDIVGAGNAGWHSIWVNRRHNEMPVIEKEMNHTMNESEPHPIIQPDYTVTSEGEMVALILKQFR
ncbi:MAG: HAD family hydrolase [Lachnospiraceae bacterium]|nr:HAD family hydrolase [Lachnospiraceae bacterium]